jgi:hypothetical protein
VIITFKQQFDYPEIKVEHILMSTREIYKTEIIGGSEMVNVPLSTSWLKEEDFQGKEVLEGNEFIDEGKIELAKDNKYGRDRFIIGVMLASGETRNVNINNTSRNLLVKEYGRDSKGWIGKRCILQGHNEFVAKGVRFVIYVRPDLR